MIHVTPTELPDVLVLEPQLFGDERGFFYESFNQQVFRRVTGTDLTFVQDNHSFSTKGVLRGLHYQLKRPQGKLVRVVKGAVFDVTVDLRKSSPTFGQWVGVELSAENRRQLWIPPGFAHGFLTLSPEADFLYKATDYYVPDDERTILWNDAELGIKWPLEFTPILSDRDKNASSFSAASCYN